MLQTLPALANCLLCVGVLLIVAMFLALTFKSLKAVIFGDVGTLD